MNFPNSPVPGQVYTPVSGYSYVFLDGVWRIVQDAQSILTADTRNRIVNGAFQIAQEQAGTTVTTGYLADQWQLNFSGGAATGSRQDFGTAYGALTVNTAVPSLAAANYLTIGQLIEGVRIRDWGWGAAGAKPVVLSFLAKFNVAGTFYAIVRGDAPYTSYAAPFTISAAQIDVWVSVTISIPGPTIGTWPTDTGRSLSFFISAAAGTTLTAPSANQWLTGNYLSGPGATNGFATAGNTFRITNVGLYLDPLATGVPPRWQMPDEAEELRACQRYWQNQKYTQAANQGVGTSTYMILNFTTMRSAPAIAIKDAGTATNVTSYLQDQATVSNMRAGIASSTAGQATIIARSFDLSARM